MRGRQLCPCVPLQAEKLESAALLDALDEAALGCAERQRQHVRRHAESAVLVVPQVATVASWGWLSGLQAA